MSTSLPFGVVVAGYEISAENLPPKTVWYTPRATPLDIDDEERWESTFFAEKTVKN
jgi:hypothetical protein